MSIPNGVEVDEVTAIKTVIYKSLGTPVPTHPHLGQVSQILPFFGWGASLMMKQANVCGKIEMSPFSFGLNKLGHICIYVAANVQSQLMYTLAS